MFISIVTQSLQNVGKPIEAEWCIYTSVNYTIIGSDNGLLPGRHQATVWTNTGILLIGPLGINFNEILIEVYMFSLRKMHLKMSSWNLRPFCLGLNDFKSIKQYQNN